MKRISMILATFMLITLFSASVPAVEPGIFHWQGHSIEMTEVNEGGMFAPADMTENEYCITLVFTTDPELQEDKDKLVEFYAEALLADPSGNTYAPQVWLTGSDNFSFMYAIPKEYALQDLTTSFGGTGPAQGEVENETEGAEEEATVQEENLPGEEQVTEAESQPEVALPDEALIDQILDALGNETYSSTRELLKDSEVVGSGYRGDAGSGVQQMLVDFGCGITVDGIVGSQTIGALHQVQESFGLPAADSVDLEAYDTLLPLLLLTKDEESASNLLYDYFEETGGAGYYDYLKGCVLYARGKYYSAKEAFESSLYGNSQERAASCLQEWPSNGELWENSEVPGSDTSLTFVVNSTDESRGICFEMFTVDGRLASVLFVKGSGSATAYLPVGTYRIRDCSGHEWYGTSEKFGPDGYYYEYLTFSEDEDTMYDAYLDYGGYQLTINASEMQGGTSVGSTSVGWDDMDLKIPDGM